MDRRIRIVSTDFDGTLFAEGEQPPVPPELEALIGQLQDQGTAWVINTGRDLPSLAHALQTAGLAVRPDFLVTVEREIHVRANGSYRELTAWNRACAEDHAGLFREVDRLLPSLRSWIAAHFGAEVYSDSYSPFCLVARNNEEADRILEEAARHFARLPDLAIVRNDVYARLAHVRYSKGTALAEIARRLGLEPATTFAAGDHWNDLPMLSPSCAGMLAAPGNAIAEVRETVRRQGGFVSRYPAGRGVLDGLRHFLRLN
jgi:hypothetical protein